MATARQLSELISNLTDKRVTTRRKAIDYLTQSLIEETNALPALLTKNSLKISRAKSSDNIGWHQLILGLVTALNMENAKKWINMDCKGNINIRHTTQFAVYTMQTYADSEAAVLAQSILETLGIDVSKALIEYGLHNDDDNDVINDGLDPQTLGNEENAYAQLEKEQIRKNSDLDYQKIQIWIGYIQSECNNCRDHKGVFTNNAQINSTLCEMKKFMSAHHDVLHIWNCFKNLNSINVLCDMIALIIMGNGSDSLRKGFTAILDILLFYANYFKKQRQKGVAQKNDSANCDGYIIKSMIDILLSYFNMGVIKFSKIQSKACSVMDKITKLSPESSQFAVEYGGIECIFNMIITWLQSQERDKHKSLIVSSLNFLDNVVKDNDINKKTMCHNGGCLHILNILSVGPNVHNDVVMAALKLLLSLTSISATNNDHNEVSESITCNLILVLINNHNILTILYNAIELLQKEKKTLYLMMDLLLNICKNCSKLSVDVQTWIIRIVLEFSSKYQKSTMIHSYCIQITTAIIEHNPMQNVQLLLQQKGLIHILETMKLSQYKEEIILLVFKLMKIITNINDELNAHFVTESNAFKFIVHVMKNWYLNEKENVESRVLIIKNCCQIITKLLVNDHCANIANQSHVTSSLIKLIIAHDQHSSNKQNNNSHSTLTIVNNQSVSDVNSSHLQSNPYLNRISMFIEILKSISTLCQCPSAENAKEISLKVAKHAIKTTLKSVEMHVLINHEMNDAHNKQQKKVLLSVLTDFCTICMEYTSSYFIKYDICPIIIKSITKYSSSTDEDFVICCKLIDFVGVLLTANNKSYEILESHLKTSALINNLRSTQKNSYRSYQPLIEACNRYNKVLQKCIRKINNGAAPSSVHPIKVSLKKMSSSKAPGSEKKSTPSSPIEIKQSQPDNVVSAPNIVLDDRSLISTALPSIPSPNFGHASNAYQPSFVSGFHHHHQAQQQQQHHHPYYIQQQQMIAMFNHQNNANGPGSVYNNCNNNNHGISPSAQQSHSHQSGMSMAALNQMQQIQQAQLMKQMQQQQSTVKMYTESAHPYHTLNVHSPKIFGHQPVSEASDIPIQNKLHSSLVQLLSTGSIMTKYPSIHTETPNYMMELTKMKCKYKLVRVSSDWQTIEFHNIQQTADPNMMMPSKGKPPKVLPIGNMKHIDSSFNDSNSAHLHQQQRLFSKSKHSLDLYIYALDKNGKEIVIKLICQNMNDTKRWTRALNQIISYFKH